MKENIFITGYKRGSKFDSSVLQKEWIRKFRNEFRKNAWSPYFESQLYFLKSIFCTHPRITEHTHTLRYNWRLSINSPATSTSYSLGLWDLRVQLKIREWALPQILHKCVSRWPWCWKKACSAGLQVSSVYFPISECRLQHRNTSGCTRCLISWKPVFPRCLTWISDSPCPLLTLPFPATLRQESHAPATWPDL